MTVLNVYAAFGIVFRNVCNFFANNILDYFNSTSFFVIDISILISTCMMLGTNISTPIYNTYVNVN